MALPAMCRRALVITFVCNLILIERRLCILNNGPLQGIRVVELSTFVAVPSCARLLADYGAEVIKIEGFSGDPWRVTGKLITKTGDEENPVYDVYNIGKHDICLNIKNEKGLACLLRMLESADIFLTNIRPQSLKKMGLDADALTARFPRLIYASLNGFGTKGPEAHRPGFDTIAFWARSGFLADMSVEENSYPVFGPTGVGDSISGTALLTGILAALYEREKTGKGNVVETSLYGAAIWFMASMAISAQEKYNWKFPKSIATDLRPLSSMYCCADGKWLFISVLQYEPHALKAFELLGIREEVAKMEITSFATLNQHCVEMRELMEKAIAKKPIDEWLRLFLEADIVADEATHFRDLSTSPQAWANEYMERYVFRGGETCAMPCPPIHMRSYKREASHYAPLPGENTDDVLRKFGYSEEEILDMHNCKAVQ